MPILFSIYPIKYPNRGKKEYCRKKVDYPGIKTDGNNVQKVICFVGENFGKL